MKKLVIISDNLIDATKVSFISKVDSKVYHHNQTILFFFTLIVEGRSVDIEFRDRNDASSNRATLIAASFGVNDV